MSCDLLPPPTYAQGKWRYLRPLLFLEYQGIVDDGGIGLVACGKIVRACGKGEVPEVSGWLQRYGIKQVYSVRSTLPYHTAGC